MYQYVSGSVRHRVHKDRTKERGAGIVMVGDTVRRTTRETEVRRGEVKGKNVN